jgi:hypothetical protein
MPDTKKYIDFTGLSYYDSKLKTWVTDLVNSHTSSVDAIQSIKAGKTELPVEEGTVILSSVAGTGSYDDLKDKPVGLEKTGVKVEILPAIYTATGQGGGLGPVSAVDFVTEGEYQVLEEGQSYNVLYKGTLYENVPVKLEGLWGKKLLSIGNFDRILMGSDLIMNYAPSIDGDLVDNGLPFAMAQFDPEYGKELEDGDSASCAFAFLTDSIEDQTLVITDASDPSKSYTAVVKSIHLDMRTPFWFSDPQLGTSLTQLITDGQEQTITVNGSEVNGTWKVSEVSSENLTGHTAIFVPEGFEAPESMNVSKPDGSTNEWPCIVLATDATFPGLISFDNGVRDKSDDRSLQHISLDLVRTDKKVLDDEYMPSKYRSILTNKDNVILDINYGLDSNGEAFTDFNNSKTLFVNPAIETDSDNNKYPFLAIASLGQDDVIYPLLGETVKITWKGNDYDVKFPVDGDSIEIPFDPGQITPTTVIGDLHVISIDTQSQHVLGFYFQDNDVQAGSTYNLKIHNSSPQINPDYLDISYDDLKNKPELPDFTELMDTISSLQSRVQELEKETEVDIEAISDQDLYILMNSPKVVDNYLSVIKSGDEIFYYGYLLLQDDNSIEENYALYLRKFEGSDTVYWMKGDSSDLDNLYSNTTEADFMNAVNQGTDDQRASYSADTINVTLSEGDSNAYTMRIDVSNAPIMTACIFATGTMQIAM